MALSSPTEKNDFSLKPNTPGVTRVNKKVVIAICAIIALVLCYTFVNGFSQQKRLSNNHDDAEEVTVNQYQTLPDGLSEMPSDYTEAASLKEQSSNPVIKPNVVYDSPTHISKASDIYNEKEMAQHIKEEEEARSSEIVFSFSGYRESPSNSYAGSGQSGDSQRIPPSPASLQADGLKLQNMQAEKKQFFNASRDSNIYMPHQKQTALTPFQLNAGAVIPASLISGINSDLPGDVIAQVRENIYDSLSGNHILIPQGTRIVGEYDSNVSFGQDRVMLVWDRLEYPDGSTLLLKNMSASDLSGYAGLSDKVDNHTFKIITAVLVSSLLNVTANEATGDSTGISRAFAEDAALGVNDASQQIVQKQLNVQPTINIRPGYSFNIIVKQNMLLEPYQHL